MSLHVQLPIHEPTGKRNAPEYPEDSIRLRSIYSAASIQHTIRVNSQPRFGAHLHTVWAKDFCLDGPTRFRKRLFLTSDLWTPALQTHPRGTLLVATPSGAFGGVLD